jgi:hypothetical protein
MNYSLLLNPKLGLGGAPAEHHYLPQMTMLSSYIFSTIALPCSVIYTGHVDLYENKKMGTHKFYPKMTGKNRTALSSWFNEVYNCYRLSSTKDKEPPRFFWQTSGDDQMDFFGSAMNTQSLYWTDPIEVNFSNPPVGFADLLKRRFKCNSTRRETSQKVGSPPR